MSKELLIQTKKILLLSKKNKDNIFLIDDMSDISNFNVKILGPANTPYQGGMFTINIQILNPESYPKHSIPTAIFITKIKHPNINLDNGNICLDILRNQWIGHTMEILDIIKGIYELLKNPNPDDPYNVDIVSTLKRSHLDYLKEITAFTKSNAEKDINKNYLTDVDINNIINKNI